MILSQITQVPKTALKVLIRNGFPTLENFDKVTLYLVKTSCSDFTINFFFAKFYFLLYD